MKKYKIILNRPPKKLELVSKDWRADLLCQNTVLVKKWVVEAKLQR